MDICDISSKYEEVYMMSAMKQNQQELEQLEKQNNKYCLYCGEPLASSGRFCCKECRDEYEHEQKVRRISGRI